MVSDGDADVGEGDGAGGEADGVGYGCGCRRGRRRGAALVTGPLLGGADQVIWTSWDAEAAESKVRVALPARVPRVTVTASVTLCPAASVPPVLLRLTSFGAELLADQRTGPSSAVRVDLPADPVPTSWVRDSRAASLPDETMPGFAVPGPDVCGAVPVDVPAATGVTSRTATGGRDDPARAKAEVMTAAEPVAPAGAASKVSRRAVCAVSRLLSMLQQ